MATCVQGIIRSRANNTSIILLPNQSSHFQHTAHIILVVCYLIAISVSVVANTLLSYVVLKKKQRKPFDFLLLNLCASHFVASIFVIPYIFIVDV